MSRLSSAHSPEGVDDDGEPGLLELLVHLLRGAIDARQPAAIAWVAVIPANDLES